MAVNALNEELIKDKFMSLSGGDLSCGLTRETFSELFEPEMEFIGGRLFEMISNKEETISYKDFLGFIRVYGDGSNKQTKVNLLFNLYNVKGDGILSRKEAMTMLRLSLAKSEIMLNPEERENILDELASILTEQACSRYRGDGGLNKMAGILRKDFYHIFDGRNEDLLDNLPISGFEWLKELDPKDNKNKAVPNEENKSQKKASNFKKYYKWVSNNTAFFVWAWFYWIANIVLVVGGTALYLKFNTTTFWHAAGRGIGFGLEFNSGVMLFTMMRHMHAALKSNHCVAAWIPFDDHRYFHIMAGKMMVCLALGHTAAHLLHLRIHVGTQDVWTFTDYLFVMDASMMFGLVPGLSYLTGLPLLLLLIVIFFFALNYVRRLSGGHKVFYITHIIGYPIYLVMAVLHAKNIWKWMVRLYKSYFSDITTIGVVEILPTRVIKLVLQKPNGFKFQPGDYILIKIPFFSVFEWHPFTISSPPENNDNITLHIQTVGSWTQKIYEHCVKESEKCASFDASNNSLQKHSRPQKDGSPQQNLTLTKNLQLSRPSRSPSVWTIDEFDIHQINKAPEIKSTVILIAESLKVLIDGPYSSATGNIFEAEHAVLIAAGIGVTPFASILQSVMHHRTREHLNKLKSSIKLKKVDFIWLNRGHNCFHWFPDMLEELEEQDLTSCDPPDNRFLDISIYNTKAVRKIDMTTVMLQLSFNLYYEKTNRDYLSKSRSRMKRGRPQWEEVFNRLDQTKKGKVTIFYCGPSVLGKKLSSMCLRYGFHFQKEIF